MLFLGVFERQYVQEVDVFDLESREDAEEFVQNDPFQAAGLFEEVLITHWRKAFYSGQRLIDL